MESWDIYFGQMPKTGITLSYGVMCLSERQVNNAEQRPRLGNICCILMCEGQRYNKYNQAVHGVTIDFTKSALTQLCHIPLMPFVSV
mmetsp:Transcript_7985/g.16625  ORF Transcript_7985/g.16625 Transcript_7985/m.16625 type:complete len:87 (+) Transcript_7985:846-1106(+)